MALFNEKQRSLALGIGIGVAAVVLGRGFLTPFARVFRPLAKAGLKSAVLAYEAGREGMARLAEQVDDLAAEVRLERETEVSEAEPGTKVEAPEKKTRSRVAKAATTTH
jgi:hypothetical protein